MLDSTRLSLVPMTVELIDALVEGDRVRAEAVLGVHFPEPLRPPPETADMLGVFRDQVRQPADFPPYLVVRSADRIVVGSAGTTAPDADGVVVLGYGIYPEHEGQGYATEAATTLSRARLADGRVRVVRATIPPGHLASERVAARAGLVATGRLLEDEGRTVQAWERGRDTAR